MIEIPNNVSVNAGILQWGKVPYADGYNVHVNKKYMLTVRGQKNTSVDISYDYDATKEYQVSAFISFEGQQAHTHKSVKACGMYKTDDMKLVVDDNFENLDGWLTRFPYWTHVINNELQDYVPEALEYGENGLKIKSSKQPNGRWKSGIVTGNVEDSYLYGYFEADIKVPTDQGLWPAFWLLNTQYVDKKPEIDIMEMVDGNVHQAYHHYAPSLNSQENQDTIIAPDGFAKYGLEWVHNRITWYLNRRPIYSVWGSTVPNQKMYPILNVAVGGTWPGDPKELLTSAEMDVKSFKVWK